MIEGIFSLDSSSSPSSLCLSPSGQVRSGQASGAAFQPLEVRTHSTPCQVGGLCSLARYHQSKQRMREL